MTLLIVDDIATDQKHLRVTLGAEGHNTLEAAAGVGALQIHSPRRHENRDPHSPAARMFRRLTELTCETIYCFIGG